MLKKAASGAAKSSLQVIAACATSGIVVGMLSLTGLGLKLSNIIIGLGKGNLFISLVCAMVVSMILGMGLPTTAAYIIAATSVAPALIELGIPNLAAHLFILYYASISAITPPVAVASYAAAGLAEENAMKVGWEAVRLGIVAFIVPFAFVLNQKLLVVITGLQIEVVIDLIFAFLTCLSLAFSAQGWLLRDISIFQRGILFLISLIMLISNNLLCLAGAVVLFALYILNKKLVKTKGMEV